VKSFLIKAIFQPFVAILFCLAFGLPFVYVGFQTVDIQGERYQDESVTISFQRRHYWGLTQVNETIENVQKATLKSSLIHRSQPRRLRSVSGVFLENETDAVRLLAGSSDVNDNLKWDAVQSINDFIKEPQQDEFRKTIRLTNLFGWFGLPFLLLGVLGLLGWPAAIIQYLRKNNHS
jgi:hypothetical protein